MPTTRLQHPGYIVLNSERYKLARRKNDAPYWKRSQIRVQPGQGEQVVSWDSFHEGMGESVYRRSDGRAGELFHGSKGGRRTIGD